MIQADELLFVFVFSSFVQKIGVATTRMEMVLDAGTFSYNPITFSSFSIIMDWEMDYRQ